MLGFVEARMTEDAVGAEPTLYLRMLGAEWRMS